MKMQPFRLRGREVTRVEAFSDVVFGFALTLIVVSLEVPQSFDELMAAMRGFPAFAICFAVLTWVWFCHHTFFARYALNDGVTIVLNAVLLFVVLFYTYPMKFMFSMITGAGRRGGDAPMLFLIYGLGFAGIFAVFVAMYLRAWSKRDELELNALERHDTITNLLMYVSYVAIGLISVTIGQLASGRTIGWAGLIYFLIGPVSAFIGYRRGAARHNLQVAMPAPSPDKAIVSVTNP